MQTRNLIVRIGGALLVVVPFIPLAADDTGYVPPQEWLLGAFVFGSAAWIIARFVPALPERLLKGIGSLDSGLLKGGRLPILSLAFLAFLLVLTSRVAFRHHPLLVDSVVQLFQAQIFASGQLTAAAPAAEAFFATQHTLVYEGRWFAQYPPGHALMLAAGVLVGLPWIAPVLMSLGSAWFMARFASGAWDQRTGRLVLVLIPFTPFFWFMGASFMNHVTCLLFVSAFLCAFQRWESGSAAGWALASGLAIGAAGLARPLTALAVAAVFAPIGVAHGIRARRFPSLGLAAVGGLTAVVAFGWFNAATTGDPLIPGYLRLWGESHGLGFHMSPWGELHTPLAGVVNEATDISLLATFLLEWPIPALLPAGLFLAIGDTDRWDHRLIVAFLAIPTAYLFYWHRDAYLGPRFLFTGVAFLVPLTARALASIPALRVRSPRLRDVVVMLVASCFVYTALYSAPRRMSAYASSFRSMKVDPSAIAASRGIDRGVVFVSVSWGNRLLARMREAGVAASTAEQVYRRLDHCDVELLLRRSRAERWPPGRVEAVLRDMPPGGVLLGAGSPTRDPTLRLTPGRSLPDACRAELAHDGPGFTNWLPFLLHNGPALDAPVLFVRDLRDRNQDFVRSGEYGSRWLLRPGGLEPLPPPDLSNDP